jgi:hypothetical protein
MPITVNCDCGHRFRVRDEYAGKRAQCPACGDPVLIPMATFQPADSNESPGEFPHFQTEAPPTFPAARRSGGQWFGSINTGLFGLGRLSGLACLVVGLVFVVLARGCDAWALHSALAVEARFQVEQSEFHHQWEDRRSDLNHRIENLRNERNDGDTPAEIQSIDSEINDLQKELNKVAEDEQLARRNKERGDWKHLKRKAQDAKARHTISQVWRELFFVLGTVVLSIGLLTVGFTGEQHERVICLIMIAIITFSIYVGGMAWINSLISTAGSLSNLR